MKSRKSFRIQSQVKSFRSKSSVLNDCNFNQKLVSSSTELEIQIWSFEFTRKNRTNEQQNRRRRGSKLSLINIKSWMCKQSTSPWKLLKRQPKFIINLDIVCAAAAAMWKWMLWEDDLFTRPLHNIGESLAGCRLMTFVIHSLPSTPTKWWAPRLGQLPSLELLQIMSIGVCLCVKLVEKRPQSVDSITPEV